MTMHRPVASVLAAFLAVALCACASGPSGPVEPRTGRSAPGVLVIDPSLAPWLDVPRGQENYSYNAQGLLEYNTVVRNLGSRPMTLSCNADFYDESDRLVDSQDPVRFFIDPRSEKPLQIAATSRSARKMRIQVRPAK